MFELHKVCLVARASTYTVTTHTRNKISPPEKPKLRNTQNQSLPTQKHRMQNAQWIPSPKQAHCFNLCSMFALATTILRHFSQSFSLSLSLTLSRTDVELFSVMRACNRQSAFIGKVFLIHGFQFEKCEIFASAKPLLVTGFEARFYRFDTRTHIPTHTWRFDHTKPVHNFHRKTCLCFSRIVVFCCTPKTFICLVSKICIGSSSFSLAFFVSVEQRIRVLVLSLSKECQTIQIM